MGLAGLRWRIGDFEGSVRDYQETLELAREQQEVAFEAAALASLSVVHRDSGLPQEPLRGGKEALGVLRDLEDPQAEAYVLSSQARSYGELGHHPSALSCLERSVKLRREVGDAEEGKLYCEYEAPSVESVFEHVQRARVPLDRAEVVQEMEPAMFR